MTAPDQAAPDIKIICVVIDSQGVALLDRLPNVLPRVDLLVERIGLDPPTLMQNSPGIEHGLVILWAKPRIAHPAIIKQPGRFRHGASSSAANRWPRVSLSRSDRVSGHDTEMAGWRRERRQASSKTWDQCSGSYLNES
jgi:hypothetical protein